MFEISQIVFTNFLVIGQSCLISYCWLTESAVGCF